MAIGNVRPSLFGFEQELALCASSSSGQELDYGELLNTVCEIAKSTLVYVDGLGESGIFLSSAARIYVDLQKLEYASPECSHPSEVVRYTAATERMVAKLAEQLRLKCKLADAGFYRCQVTYGSEATWGHHESYLTRNEPSRLSSEVIPFLVARVVTAGAGGFLPMTAAGCSFTLSTRASHMGLAVASSSTTPHERGIFHLKDESLTSGKYHRLHCLVGEHLCSHQAEWLRTGSTALVVAMADAGIRPGKHVQLADPVRAINQFASDPTCKVRVPMRKGRAQSAVDIQRHYLALAEKHVGANWMPAWAGEVIAAWEQMLNRLDGAPDSVANVLDWAIKHRVFSAHLAKRGFTWKRLGDWSAVSELFHRCRHLGMMKVPGQTRSLAEDILDVSGPLYEIAEQLRPHLAARGMMWEQMEAFESLRHQLFALDFQFGRCGPAGIFNKLDGCGVLAHRVAGVDEPEIMRAMTQPPELYRARLRGQAISRLHGQGVREGANWETVFDPLRQMELDLRDPFAAEEHWTAVPPSPNPRTRLQFGLPGMR